jgi:hypothetical protein
MALYGIDTLPLVHKLKEEATQVWYADDDSAGGKASNLKKWWDSLISHGPALGYFPNPAKTWVIV